MSVFSGLMVAISLALLGHDTGVPHDGCVCDEIARVGGWCSPCQIGYMAGLRIESETLVEALDPRGHLSHPAYAECAGCRAASARDGICGTCGWGIIGDRVYASKLAFYLARGTPRSETCAAGASHGSDHGWCATCGTGWVGTSEYRDRAVHAAAAREFELFQLALRSVTRCETCAVARYFGSSCAACGISYRGGEPRDDAQTTAGVPDDGER